ncbi:hypothetical protein QQY66_47360 [Streptomyces sp. DG2A-72]|nr:hypothetical protein [Streptomyces sp. DG2A-72]MDO0938969.1 hypothetical protein [Streptomyces sp. DG2A-72]
MEAMEVCGALSGGEEGGEEGEFEIETVVERAFERGVHRALGGCQGVGRAGRVAVCPGLGRVDQGAFGDDLVNQADPLGLGRVDLAAGEEDVLGPGQADQAGQALGSAGAGD